jgi:glutathione peroxidase
MKPIFAVAVLCFSVLAQAGECSSLLDKNVRPLADKESVNLCKEYQGKVLLIVNTASKCGFTPQYEGLEKLHAELGAKGFSVLGFPSNDFMGQEPGSEEEIQKFCTLTYGVKFPMFEKTTVKGEQASPLYRELEAVTGNAPGWNFHKYLVGRDGKVIKDYGSRVKPDDATLRADIEKALAKP